jgi:hypothetical protein
MTSLSKHCRLPGLGSMLPGMPHWFIRDPKEAYGCPSNP